ncbi:MAG: hypothetical protein KKA60_03965 [Proteobacteria bacterium]|nr:hypothetical protein [Pseudomonadota bacterium]
MDKTVTVLTNDPKHAKVEIRIAGDVEPLAIVNPKTVKLQGYEGGEITGEVHIAPNPKYPFKITGTTTSPSPKFYHRLDKVEGKDEYVLMVRNMDEAPGTYSGAVNLITDSNYQKTLTIQVFGRILPKPGQDAEAAGAVPEDTGSVSAP